MRRGRPRVLDAAKTVTFRVRSSELKRAEKLIEATGRTQADILREALSQLLDQYDSRLSA